MEQNSGIYSIINTINNKMYIGSSKHLSKRKTRHFYDLRNNKHHNVILQRAFEKYGETSFTFEVIEYCSEEELFKLEQYYIDTLAPEYNIGSVGGGDNLTNNPNRLLIIEKIRAGVIRKNSMLTKEERLDRWSMPGSSNPNWKGGVSSPLCPICEVNHMAPNAETCSFCRNRSGEANPFYGKKHTEESLKKMSQSKLGTSNQTCWRPVSDGNGNTWESVSSAAKELGLSESTITVRCTRGTYGWHYLEKKTPKFKYSIDGVMYETIAQASKALGIHVNTISYRLNSNNFTNYKKL